MIFVDLKHDTVAVCNSLFVALNYSWLPVVIWTVKIWTAITNPNPNPNTNPEPNTDLNSNPFPNPYPILTVHISPRNFTVHILTVQISSRYHCWYIHVSRPIGTVSVTPRWHDATCCQTGCQNPFDKAVECLHTRYNPFDNRFGNRLYRVNGV